ncbi:MAG: isopeptide-forming domain-containing fimbrial protein [Clostridium sp.]|uniref:isopeptide-forming domain-containing fimbrial protein n=1 Tax=Clostridium sp. TaxID=1506 RepID=UPI002902886F|nr:isopeptide-forming domain-containing fimbrial protein [Clostridium sp.]MDU2680337.1 isopeptide-forming domain-containing fimbrial protein [Clostridium sp.]
MARYKILKTVFSYILVAGVLATSILPSIVASAETIGITSETLAFQTANTPSGIANLGRGSASITITGNGFNQSLVGKKFNVYKLFDAENSVNLESINYTINPTYKTPLQNVVGRKLSKEPSQVTEYEVIDYIQSLNTNKVEGAHADQTLEGRYSDFRYFVEELRNEITRLGIKSDVVNVTQVKVDNSIDITGIDYGYYIVDEVSNVQGSHSAGSLCMVNTANPNAQVQIKSDYPTVIKKIQEDDNKEIIGEEGWNDIADYEIGQTVPYKFVSNIPNMNGYGTYYWAWHDIMHEALTFNPNSVSVKITEQDGKVYTLAPDEFHIVENPGGGETFKVEITDLKYIVDREFNNKNNNNENIYGQQIELFFTSTLNDKAANYTGRPGFENDVRLEFSNNPDSDGNGSTGFTPWDTVVCFTYKINGLKTNDHDAPLEGAKFRLYSDKECKNEVYLKKSENGYIVINRDSAGDSVPEEAVEMVSDGSGNFVIIGLDQGTYYAKETGAPNGYRPILDPIEITVAPTFTEDRNNYIKGDGATDKTLQKLEASAKIKTFWEGIFNEDHQPLETNVEDGSVNITVINKVGSKLPVTGSVGTVVLLTLGSTLMTGALTLSRKKNNKSQE